MEIVVDLVTKIIGHYYVGHWSIVTEISEKSMTEISDQVSNWIFGWISDRICNQNLWPNFVTKFVTEISDRVCDWN